MLDQAAGLYLDFSHMLLQVDQEGVRGIEVSDLGGSWVEDHHVDLSSGLDACNGGFDPPRYVWAGARPVWKAW